MTKLTALIRIYLAEAASDYQNPQEQNNKQRGERNGTTDASHDRPAP